MNIIPQWNMILIKQMAVDNKTASGLIIPDADQQEMLVKGKVILVGPGRVSAEGTLIPNRNEVDTIVVYNRHAGIPVKDGLEKYVLVKDTDTIALWTGEVTEET